MRRKIGGGVELAEVEFVTVAHAVVAFSRAHAGEHDEIDAVRLDGTVGERANKVVTAGREGQLQAHEVIQVCDQALAGDSEKELVTNLI